MFKAVLKWSLESFVHMNAMSHKMTLSLLYEVIQLPETFTDMLKDMVAFYGRVCLTHFAVEML